MIVLRAWELRHVGRGETGSDLAKRTQNSDTKKQGVIVENSTGRDKISVVELFSLFVLCLTVPAPTDHGPCSWSYPVFTELISYK